MVILGVACFVLMTGGALAWDCRVYSANDRRYYFNLGCKVQCAFMKSDQDECCVITKCPQTCLDNNGDVRKKGEDWAEPVPEDKQFKRLCSCLPFSSVVPFGPDEKTCDGSIPYTKNCLLAGCEMRKTVNGAESLIFVRPGDAVLDSNGKKCRCVNGTDPFLMDASTLYHFSCAL